MIAVKVITGVLIVVTTVGVMCRTVSTEEDYESSAFKKQQNEIKSKFKCKDPQPRTVYPHEIIGDEEWVNKSYNSKVKDIKPIVVVLHRCENSGCCKYYDQRCKPKNESNLNITFTLLVIDPKSKTSNKTYIQATAKNHTSCQCQEINEDQIK